MNPLTGRGDFHLAVCASGTRQNRVLFRFRVWVRRGTWEEQLFTMALVRWMSVHIYR